MRAVVPIRHGVLPAGAAEAIAECSGRAILIGSDCADAVEELVGIATELTLVEAGPFAPGAWATALAPIIDTDVVLPASADGRDLAPRLAAAMHRPLYAAALQISPDLIELTRNAGLIVEDVVPSEQFVATLVPGVRGVDVRPDAAPPTITTLALSLGDTTAAAPADAILIEELAADAATMDLAESKRILGGGAGLNSAEAFATLQQISTAINGSMGATRVITDRGWISHDRQIGTTGVVVDPDLYLAFGISGAVQHTSGLGNPHHIISVNTDPHCPMMHLADLAIVADANEVVTHLHAKLVNRG